MSQTKTGGLDLLGTLQKVRDAGVDAWAKAALAITGSAAYARLNGVISQPGLLAAAALRKAREAAMSQILAQLNMPSREDVLSLSQRLTRMEMVLDDLGAAMDAVRASSARPQGLVARDPEANGARNRPRAAGEG